mgnify:CR=1 FL=1
MSKFTLVTIIATKKFGTVTATIEPNSDREGVECYVCKEGAFASLACAQGEGYIQADNGEEIYFAESTADKVWDWASTYGY